MYAVILAGGGGTRLWPLSRPDRPKPFLPLIGDRTLLQRTWDRIVPDLVEARDVAVVTDRRYEALVREQLPNLAPGMLLAEPVGRNTAAAVALATAVLDRRDEEVMLVLPADHLVADEPGFRALLRRAAGLAADGVGGRGRLVTLGIAPTGPETGYGYVVAGPPIEGREPAHVVARFAEKPTAVDAAQLLAGPAPVAWNAGIFLWRRDAIHAAFSASAPDILATVEAGVVGGADALESAYTEVRAISIDYAVLEPASAAGRVAMLRADVGWSDLGSWSALRDALAAQRDAGSDAAGGARGTVGWGPRSDLGSTGTLVIAAGRPVVTIGLSDVIVVDAGDVLLVAAADASQEVKVMAEAWAAGRIGQTEMT